MTVVKTSTGVFVSGSGGGGGGSNDANTLFSTDAFEMVIGLSEGPIHGLEGETVKEQLANLFVNDVPVMSQAGTMNFQDSDFVIRYESGLELTDQEDPERGQSPIRYMLGGQATPNNVSAELLPSVEIVRTIPHAITGQYDRVEVRLLISQLYKATDKGTKVDTLPMLLRWRYAGETTWKVIFQGVIRGKTTVGGYVKAYSFAVDDKTRQVEISVTNTHSPNVDDEEHVHKVSWLNYETEKVITDENPEYHPNTAMLHVVGLIGNEITQLPVISGVWKGMVCSVPSNYNPTTREYNENSPWDGEFASQKVWTDNPFWIAYELITNPNFGLYRYNPRIRVNRYSFYALAKDADELVEGSTGEFTPRYTFNALLADKQDGLDLINYILGSAQSRLIDGQNGELVLVSDRNTPAVATITPEQCLADENEVVFNYTHTDIKDRINEVVTSYIDENLSWERQTIGPFSDIESQNKYGVNTEEYDSIGCIYPDEVKRKAYLRLIGYQTETMSVTFRVPANSAVLQLFDIINIVDPDQNWGISGRVRSYNAQSLILRDPLYFEEINNYRIVIPLKTGGEFEAHINIPTVGFHSELYIISYTLPDGVSTPTSFPEGLATHTPFSIQRSDSEPGLAKPFRVLSVRASDENNSTFTITAIEVNRNKWAAADNLELVGSPQYSFKTPPIPEKPKNVTLLKQEFETVDEKTKINLWLGWDEPIETFLGHFYEVSLKRNSVDLGVVVKSSTNIVEIPELDFGDYEITVAMVFNGQKEYSDVFSWEVKYLSFLEGEYAPERLETSLEASYNGTDLYLTFGAWYSYNQGSTLSLSDIITNKEIKHAQIEIRTNVEGEPSRLLKTIETTQREAVFTGKEHLEANPDGYVAELSLELTLIDLQGNPSPVFVKELMADNIPDVTGIVVDVTYKAVSAVPLFDEMDTNQVDVEWYILEVPESGLGDVDFNDAILVDTAPKLLDYIHVDNQKQYCIWAKSISEFWESSLYPAANAPVADLVVFEVPIFPLEELAGEITDIGLPQLSEDAQTLIEDINTQVDRLRPDTEDNIPEVLARTVEELNLERQARTDIEQGVFDLSAEYTAWRQRYEQRQLDNERLIGAAVYIDPESGTIINRAFAYTDEAFTEANVLIDGVNASIELQANRITGTNERLTQAEATLTVQAGQINQRATFTEVRTEIAGAIEALTPAYSWQFNTSLEDFTGAIEHNPLGFVTTNGEAVTPAISFIADDNPMLRLRVRKKDSNSWVGKLYIGEAELVVNVLEPDSLEWETKSIDLNAVEGYSGEVTIIKLELGHADIDFIEIGKRSVNDLALNDITARTTMLENDIDAGTGIMAQYATTNWVNELGYQTQSNVNAIIDSFNATYQISATLQEFSENDTLTKANNAQQFINGAEAYIESRITAFNNEEGSVNAQFSDVTQRLDALNGTITDNIVQVRGLELDLRDANLNDVIAAVNDFNLNHELTGQSFQLAVANQELKARTDELESVASYTLELGAQFNFNLSAIRQLNYAFANEVEASTQRYEEFNSFTGETSAKFQEVAETFSNQTQAFSTIEEGLISRIEDESSLTLAEAKKYTRTAVGYCLDAEGNITSQSDAVQCVTDGGSWVDGPLAEYISNLQISDGESTASIKELKQVFKKVNGELVARGGWVLDNNGRAVSVAGYNDGETGNLDLVADVIRHGVMVGDTFIPTIYVDNTDPTNPVHTFRGRMVLGDGYAVESVADIRAQDGAAGSPGVSAYALYADRGYIEITGNTVTKTQGSNSWDASVASLEKYETATVTCRFDANATAMVGLARNDANGAYSGIAYALYGRDGEIFIYEYGSSRGKVADYVESDVMSISCDGLTVKYFKNGALIYTSAVSPSGSYKLNAALYRPNTSVYNLSITPNGRSGSRGSVTIDVATSNGVWYDSTANSSLPDGIPVTHDRVTIYKSSNPAVRTTKRYNGSSWTNYTLTVHGSALIEDTVDAKVLRAGTRISSPRIDLIGDSFMKIEYAPGFGPDNVWYWYGPKILSNGLPNLDALTKANALEWKDTGGNGYFGGSIVAGTYSTALTTTDLSADAFVEIGPFGSNGGVINIVCSLQLNSRATGSSTNAAGRPSDPEYTIQLSELINGSWVVRQTQTYHGEGRIIHNEYDQETDKYYWILSQSASGSFTYTDNKRTTTDRTYKLAITSRSGVNIYGSWQNPSQRLSIISQED